MKVRRLRKFVIPTVYSIAIVAMFATIVLIGKTINSFSDEDINSYVVDPIVEEEETTPVMNQETQEIINPFTDESVVISKNFYDKDADETTQQNSIIYYENTYMQNTGVLYTSENSYDIVAVADGKVTDVKTDEILGSIVQIEHENDLKTVYQSVKDVQVKVGDQVSQGDIIAKSGENKLSNTNKNCLLFEVYQKGSLVNPQTFLSQNQKANNE